jgi:hypothetical protein
MRQDTIQKVRQDTTYGGAPGHHSAAVRQDTTYI